MFRSWQTLRSIPRLRQIFMVVARHGFGHVLSRLPIPFQARMRHLFKKNGVSKLSQPERLRRMFEDLGPTFVKLGQILATRPDIIPPEYVAELGKLHDRTEPLPFAAIRPVIAQELGGEVEDLFAHVDATSLGSASIAQVHRARTRTGREVVIKVQRPGVERTIERDLKILALLADILADVKDLAHFDPPAMVRGFERAIRRELDFRHELHSADRVARENRDSRVRIPHPVRELSSQRVLTLEFLPGARLSEARFSAESGHRLAQGLTAALFHQMFFEGVFHADPHPGNVVLMNDGELGLLDFGNTGLLSPGAIGELLGFMTSLVQRDYTLLARQVLRSGYVTRNVDQKELASELMDCLDPYYGLPLAEIELAPLVSAFFAILMRYRIRVPSQYVLLGRALVLLEGTARRLDPSFSVVEEMKPHTRRLILERWKPQHVLRELKLNLYDLTTTLRDLPGAVGGVMHRLQEGNLRTRIVIEDIKNLEAKLDRISAQLPLGLIASSVLLSGTLFIILGRETRYGTSMALGAYILAGLLGLWFLWPRRK